MAVVCTFPVVSAITEVGEVGVGVGVCVGVVVVVVSARVAVLLLIVVWAPPGKKHTLYAINIQFSCQTRDLLLSLLDMAARERDLSTADCAEQRKQQHTSENHRKSRMEHLVNSTTERCVKIRGRRRERRLSGKVLWEYDGIMMVK